MAGEGVPIPDADCKSHVAYQTKCSETNSRSWRMRTSVWNHAVPGFHITCSSSLTGEQNRTATIEWTVFATKNHQTDLFSDKIVCTVLEPSAV